jgi:FkbM family methyltransferase
MLLSRAAYYASSIPTLLLGVRNPARVLATMLGFPARKPFVIELRGSGSRLLVRSRMDVWIVKETCLDRDYERGGVALRDGWVVLDIGAGLGDFSVHASRRFPHSVVYAFEPFPESFALLQQNLALNGVQNVRAFPCAVTGGRTDGIRLYTGGTEAVQHSTAAVDRRGGVAAIATASTTLDQIFEDHQLTRCDFLKIDCEGAEFDILFRASERTLASVRYVALEYHDGVTAFSHRDLVRFFGENGFRVKRSPNPVHRDLGLLFAYNTRS